MLSSVPRSARTNQTHPLQIAELAVGSKGGVIHLL